MQHADLLNEESYTRLKAIMLGAIGRVDSTISAFKGVVGDVELCQHMDRDFQDEFHKLLLVYNRTVGDQRFSGLVDSHRLPKDPQSFYEEGKFDHMSTQESHSDNSSKVKTLLFDIYELTHATHPSEDKMGMVLDELREVSNRLEGLLKEASNEAQLKLLGLANEQVGKALHTL